MPKEVKTSGFFLSRQQFPAKVCLKRHAIAAAVYKIKIATDSPVTLGGSGHFWSHVDFGNKRLSNDLAPYAE